MIMIVGIRTCGIRCIGVRYNGSQACLESLFEGGNYGGETHDGNKEVAKSFDWRRKFLGGSDDCIGGKQRRTFRGLIDPLRMIEYRHVE